MKALKILAIAGALTAVATTAMAEEAVVATGAVVKEGYQYNGKELLPVGARLEVGTTGYGGAFIWQANPYVNLVLGYNGGDISWSGDLKINGSTYDMKMKNNLAYLNTEIHPWGASDNTWVQGLYVVGGVAYVDSKYDLDRNVAQGRNFTVNNTDFNASSDVRIAGQLKYDNDIAPYVGFGISPKINKNWGLFAEAGAYYTGNPSVDLALVSGTATNGNGADLGSEIAQEQNNIANKDKYKWLPVGKVGVNFYW